MERITAALIALVSFIAYPALIVAVAAGVSGCATEVLAQPRTQQGHSRRFRGNCNVSIAYPALYARYDSWVESGVGIRMAGGQTSGDRIFQTLTVPCGTTVRWNGTNQDTAAHDRWLCMSWMNMTSTPWGPSSVEYWIDDDPIPYLADCQADPELPFGGGNFIIRL